MEVIEFPTAFLPHPNLHTLYATHTGSKDQLTEMELKRATHAVTEIDRSIRSRDILKQGKYHEFGQLMTESHYSLRLATTYNIIMYITLPSLMITCDDSYIWLPQRQL